MQSLFRNRNFVFVWLASVFDNISLGIVLYTQNWYVVDALHMKSQLAWVTIATTVPRLGLMLYGGVLADRLPKIGVMATTFIVRLAVMLIGALLLWQDARADALRRLHLEAARAGDTLFVMLRPLSAARQPSPAVLRVALYPVPGGVSLDIVKRRGPARSEPLTLDLPSPIVESRYARLARHPSAAPAARRVRPAAV